MKRDLRVLAAVGSLSLALAATPESGRYLETRPFRYPGEHVDARGIDSGGQPANVGRV